MRRNEVERNKFALAADPSKGGVQVLADMSLGEALRRVARPDSLQERSLNRSAFDELGRVVLHVPDRLVDRPYRQALAWEGLQHHLQLIVVRRFFAEHLAIIKATLKPPTQVQVLHL